MGLNSLLNNERVTVMQSTNGKEQEKRSKIRQNVLIDYPEDWNEWLGGEEVDTLCVCECVNVCVCVDR